MMEIKIDRETFDYEEINGQLYMRAKGMVEAICNMISDEEEVDELLEQGLGIDRKGERV